MFEYGFAGCDKILAILGLVLCLSNTFTFFTGKTVKTYSKKIYIYNLQIKLVFFTR